MDDPRKARRNEALRRWKKNRLTVFLVALVAIYFCLFEILSALETSQVLTAGRRHVPPQWITYHDHPARYVSVLIFSAAGLWLSLSALYLAFIKRLDPPQ